MSESPNHRRAVDRAASWTLILAVALALRVAAAAVVTWYARRKGTLCLFADTDIYWELARTIVMGEPYRVFQWGVPHYALRTPGYPLFLAACREVFGASLVAVRLVQAGLGVVGVWLVGRLAASAVPWARRSGWTVPLVAAGIAAVEPYVVGMSALVLSEALFLPMMLAGLWALAVLWRRGDEPGPGRPIGVAVGAGLAMGAAVLARPSWALLLPGVLGAWVVGAGRVRRPEALRGALIVGLASAAVLAPWWARNARVFGRFVPTAMWVGASLYDGINPRANGESDMEFVNDPGARALGEFEQDAAFRERSIAFARSDPGRVLALAAVKFGRFWSPWPNAGALRAPGVALASALVTIPVYLLIGVGAWDRRRDPRALALLIGPMAYFCLLHMVFVSSVRYRIPGEVPALGLAAVGFGRLAGWRTGDD